MKPFSLYTEEKSLKHKVNNHEISAKIKQQIKQLRGNMVRFFWERKGESSNVVGTIKELYDTEFDFAINGGSAIRMRYNEIINIEKL